VEDPRVIAAIVSGILSTFVALLTSTLAFWGYWRSAKAELEKIYNSRFNERKWEAYQDFVMMQSRQSNVMTPESAEIRGSLLLVASDEVIKAYIDYVSLSFQEEYRETRREKVAAMITEMRKDLGYDSKSSPEVLWTMFESIHEM
jgi:hypothetical protein